MAFHLSTLFTDDDGERRYELYCYSTTDVVLPVYCEAQHPVAAPLGATHRSLGWFQRQCAGIERRRPICPAHALPTDTPWQDPYDLSSTEDT